MKAYGLEAGDRQSGAAEGFLGIEHRQEEGTDTVGEEALIVLLRQGDPEGLVQIRRKHHDRLFSVAYRICGNHQDAEEVLQDVYLTAVHKIDRFEERSTLATWLYRITVNAALMKRRSRRHSRSMVPMENVEPYLGQDENPLRFDGQARSQDDLLLAKELSRRIREAVDGLPEIYRTVFSLRDLQGYSIRDTSRILKTTPAAIKSRLHRGRFFIREELKRYLADN